MQVTTGKLRHPQSIGYNHLIPLRFNTVTLGASVVPTTVEARIPLGLNVKIMSVSYVLSSAPAGTVSMNIVSGAGSYETAGSAPFGTIIFGGTYVIGDTITLTIGTTANKITISSRNAGNNVALAANLAEALNRNLTFGTAYMFYSSGATMYIANIAYSTAGNSTALTVAVSSSAGTATASGATLTGGTAGTLPAAPLLDNSNITSYPQTAQAGSALFPVDVPLNVTADVPTVVYPINPKNFEAIWPAASELTLRVATNGAGAGNLDVVLWGVPYDVYSFNPELRNQFFLPGPYNI